MNFVFAVNVLKILFLIIQVQMSLIHFLTLMLTWGDFKSDVHITCVSSITCVMVKHCTKRQSVHTEEYDPTTVSCGTPYKISSVQTVYHLLRHVVTDFSNSSAKVPVLNKRSWNFFFLNDNSKFWSTVPKAAKSFKRIKNMHFLLSMLLL